MTKIKMMLRMADAIPKDRLIWEIERAVRNARAKPDDKNAEEELLAFCTVFATKSAIDKEGLEKCIDMIEKTKRLSEFFDNRDN